MYMSYMLLWGSMSEPHARSVELSAPFADAPKPAVQAKHPTPVEQPAQTQNDSAYWQDKTCPATYASTSPDKTVEEIAVSVSTAYLLIGLGPANSANLEVIATYLSSTNPCLIGAGIAIVKATGAAALTPDIKTQLTNISAKYKTSEPWLTKAAQELL